MNQKLRLSLILLLIILFIAGILGLYIWLSRDAIKQYAITQLNSKLAAPVAVSGIDISFFKQFPKVSLQFSDVSIADPLRAKQTFFEAKQVFIAFDIYDVLTKSYKIKLIAADSGKCSIFINTAGNGNYHILRSDGESKDDLLLSLDAIVLNHILFDYENLADQQWYKAEAVEAKLKGNIQSKREELTCIGLFDIEKVKSGKMTIVKRKKVNIDIVLAIDETQSVYELTKADLAIGTLKLKVKGRFKQEPKNTETDLQFAASQMAIIDFLEILPGDFKKYVQDYKSEGNIYLKGSITGNSSNGLATRISFGINNGTLTAPITQGKALKNINCKGECLIEKDMRKAFLKIPELNFILGKKTISGALTITDFNQPVLDLKITGGVDAEDLLAFINTKAVTTAKGSIQFNASIKGRINELGSQKGFLNTTANGHFLCKLDELGLAAYPNTPITKLNADFILNKHDLTIQTFKAQIGESDITVNGALSGFIPYVFTNGEKLIAQVTLTSNMVNIKNMMHPATSNSTVGKEQKAFALPKFIEVDANLSIGKIVLNDFTAQSVSGAIRWKGNTVEANAIKAQSMGGKIECSGSVENAADGRFLVAAKVQTDKVDLTEAFRQCQNFGQNEITDRHLRGLLSSNIDIVGVWSSALDCDLDKLYAEGKVLITQGQLLNYQPMESLSKFVDVQDLRNLKFADLSNTIEVKNRTITIPAMRVSSNALNLDVYGSHTFENYMDYHIKIKLNELLAKKYKLTHSEFEEESVETGSNLFINMKGTPDNLKFTYDKKQARKQVKEDIKKERDEVKKLWRKELGIEKDETIKEKKAEGEELEFEDQ